MFDFNLDQDVPDIAITKVSFYPAQQKLGRYRICPSDLNDSGHQNFVLKHRRFELDEVVPEIHRTDLENVFVNNLGHYVRPAAPDIGGVQYSSFMQFPENVRAKAKPVDTSLPETSLDYAINLARPGDFIFGHWLIDILPRLWLLKTRSETHELKYVIRAGLPGFVKQMLHAIDIAPEDIVEHNPNTANLHIKRAVYVTNLRLGEVIHPRLADFADWWMKSVRSHKKVSDEPMPPLSKRDKLFISRRHLNKANPHRVCENNEELETFFEQEMGFTLISPQKFTLYEQVELLENTEFLFGEEGSGMHNSLFCSADTKVAVFRNRRNQGLIQSGLCRCKGQVLQSYFGEFAGTGPFTRESNFTISLDKITREAVFSKDEC